MAKQNDLTTEDIQNLIGWLQEILKEAQETRGATHDMRDKINLLPEIRDHVSKGGSSSTDTERKIDDTRNHLESKLNHIEATLNEFRGLLHNIRDNLNRIKP